MDYCYDDADIWMCCCLLCTIHCCSLKCCLSHKSSTGCSGRRDKTAYIPLSNFDEKHLCSDLFFLEDVMRLLLYQLMIAAAAIILPHFIKAIRACASGWWVLPSVLQNILDKRRYVLRYAVVCMLRYAAAVRCCVMQP